MAASMRRASPWVLIALWALAGCGGGRTTDAAITDASDSSDSDAVEPTDIGLDAVVGHPDAGPSCVRGDFPDVWLRDPPPLPTYSNGVCPVLHAGQTADTSRNDNFLSGGHSRAFYLLVPSYYSPDHPLPMVVGWHWLAGNASQLIHEGEIEQAVEQMGFIAVIPEALRDADGGLLTYGFDWPFIETAGQEPELQFFDDMLACVTQQYRVDPRQIHGVGVSAGALWLTLLSTTTHVNHLASVASLSGGLGQQPHVLSMHFAAQDNKFPALVLWGGPTDRLIIDFQQASTLYRDALRCDHHFVVQCVHDAGHAVPPLPVPDGGTRFSLIWQFMLDHPYGLGPDQSPYLDGGLPSSLPAWCGIVP
jgi:poly(3-hydroxybutyrate) depolymerase